jgi:replicative DNA helicase
MGENGHRPTAADIRAGYQATAADVRAGWEAAGPIIYLPELSPREEVLAAERAVLGSAIWSADAALEAVAVLSDNHFSDGAHANVFAAVMRLTDAGDPVGPASVLSELARTGELDKVSAAGLGSGGAYLHSLIERRGDVRYHAAKVLADYRRRAAGLALKQCVQITESAGWDPDVHLDEIRKRVEDATAFAGTSALRANSETVDEVLDVLERDIDPGLSTGYPDLDGALGGLRPGELTVIGGRPGQGKSLLGLCIADHVGTRLGLPVLFSSLEMTEEQLTVRRIAAEAGVPLVNLVRHQVAEDDWDRITRAHDRLTATGLHVDDTPKVSFAHIRGRLQAMARTGNAARLLVIDYLGFMAPPTSESRQQAVAELARQAHDTAREFAIPVILLAQLNRLVESRSDKQPALSDLRESGEIEQSADIVILLHREDAYVPESPRAGEIDLIIRKNRQGPLCTVTLLFQGHYGRIVSMSREWSPSSSLGGGK